MILNITNYYAYLDYDFAKDRADELLDELIYATSISDWQYDVKSRIQRNETVFHPYVYSESADVRVYLSVSHMYCVCGHTVNFYSERPYFEVCSESPSEAVEFFIGRKPYLSVTKDDRNILPTTEQAIKAYIKLIWPWAVTARIVDGTFYVYSQEPYYDLVWERQYGSQVKMVYGLAKALHLDNLTEEEEKNWGMDF